MLRRYKLAIAKFKLAIGLDSNMAKYKHFLRKSEFQLEVREKDGIENKPISTQVNINNKT